MFNNWIAWIFFFKRIYRIIRIKIFQFSSFKSCIFAKSKIFIATFVVILNKTFVFQAILEGNSGVVVYKKILEYSWLTKWNLAVREGVSSLILKGLYRWIWSNEAVFWYFQKPFIKGNVATRWSWREENSSRCHDWRFKMQQKTYYLLHPHQSLLLNCEGIWDISIHNGSKSDCKFFHMHCNMQNKFPEIFSTES